ncbi:OmpA family protein [Hydrogenophaga sp. RWCD_12]|uniref:OmpA family protein n=1 Tax=Hydrogenophaga sp. RWCD_12 TaxID=3391190 RepID=UPI0039849EDA
MAMLSMAMPVAAQTADADLAGAKDHPYIKRFANSSIVLYDAKQFDSVKIPVSTFTQFNLTSRQREFVEPPVTAEGARTRIWYEAKGDTTSIEVFRNYLHELQEQGFAVLYDSSKDSKAGRWNGYLTAYGFGSNKLTNNRSEFVMYGAPMKSIHTLSAKREKDGQTTYVHLTTVQWDQDNKTFKAHKGAYATLDVVDVGAMKQNMVVVSASAMAQSMAATGRVALYGILFDTGKADVKPESKPALEEIAKLLKSDSNLRLRVVGHTDNQGSLDGNIALSKRRAESVNAALVGQYGISGQRLSAFGVADLAPVASNAQEEGRSKNRRVELVPQ